MNYNKNINKIIASISEERFYPYLKRNTDKENALLLYEENIYVSQSFYPLLAILEVTLRNKINQSCILHFKNDNWLFDNLPFELNKNIEEIKIRIIKLQKTITHNKILSELNFGFWTTLFNRQYAKLFWKPLHRIFVNIPKEQKKRHEVSAMLNHIRIFRNRIYHYEPIIWHRNALIKQKSNILQIINWLDEDTANWAKTFV